MAVLTIETRGGLVENVHSGAICVVSERGVEYSVGRYAEEYFFRSTSKPIQALPVLMLGLDKKYGLTDGECAIMMGSNAGETYCAEVVESLMKKTGVTEGELVMNPTYPSHEKTKHAVIAAGEPPKKIWHGCTPKHIGYILVQREFTGSGKGYQLPDSAVQRMIRELLAIFTDIPFEQIKLGCDGCGVPVFAVPGPSLALSYLRMACPDLLSDKTVVAAAAKMADLMNRYPQFTKGREYISSVMNAHPNIVAKDGASGVFAFGLKRERLGIMLKLYDGVSESWQCVIAEILRQVSCEINKELIHELETKQLQECVCKDIYNMSGKVVGEMLPVFQL